MPSPAEREVTRLEAYRRFREGFVLTMDMEHPIVCLGTKAGPRAIEDDSFPFEALSQIAEVESWRKEINRPMTHIHKWWAQRLGTVVRALAIGSFAPSGADVLDLFYRPVRVPDGTIFDPFMGSGTTLVEAVKLGAKVAGRDINPVAHFIARCSFLLHDREAIIGTYRAIERDVADEVRSYYRVTLPDGRRAEALYIFWVMTVGCPFCGTEVDLFASRIFACHVHPKKVTRAQAVCPHCGAIAEVRVEARETRCASCNKSFDPGDGPAKGQIATCHTCNRAFPIAKAVRAAGGSPRYRMYAKLVLLPDGSKAYYPIDDEDRENYAKSERALAKREKPYPIVPIGPGYNTDQVLNYGYRHWHEMFNARQLLCLSILADRIREISDPAMRDLFTCLFSGALEFNNMFASYKGEGTGAVRHMFAHHILKPERTPLEANLWGTPKSSGAFSTLFKRRILRALDYAENPFELRVTQAGKTEKVYGLSAPIRRSIAESGTEFGEGRQVYLSCGDSGQTDLPDAGVDVVLTDPPFFDNVHYSQLADFFYVWQRHILGAHGHREPDTTRSNREVQNTDEAEFAARLCAVWCEAHRVLKEDGLLICTYHHSRAAGWRCMLQALMRAGFWISAVFPIKAEVSVAMPKRRAKQPIDLDIILVCRKRKLMTMHCLDGDVWRAVAPLAQAQADRLRRYGRILSRNDVRNIVMAQVLRQLSCFPVLDDALHQLDLTMHEVETLISRIHAAAEQGRSTL